MLTPHQRKTYEFIERFIKSKQYAPTISEIADGIGVKSRNLIQRHLKAMVAHGLIYLVPHRRRNICLVDAGSIYVPLIGSLSAGNPIEAMGAHETVDIAHVMLGPNRYALRIKGDAMIDEGMFDGDIVICERAQHIHDNDIVVALIDNREATVKRFHREGSNIQLIPANKTMHPMRYASDRVSIQGKVLGLLRVC